MVTKKYTYQRDRYDQPLHMWSVVDERGGIHVWIIEEKDGDYHGGYEVHHRSSPYRSSPDKPPSNEHCWLLDGPCWHDGSSLYAREYWIPRWLNDPADHDGMLGTLESQLEKRFAEVDE